MTIDEIKTVLIKFILGNKFVPIKLKTKLELRVMRKCAAHRLKPRTQLRFEVNITDHCNLNCLGCEHFSPLAKESYIDTGKYEQDCERLGYLLGGEMENIHLMGGEPLLHPQFNEIVKITRKHFKSGVIEIVTNGILLTKQDKSFWDTCMENDVRISMTQYPIELDCGEIENIAASHGVQFGYYAIGKNTMQKRPFDLEGKQDIEETIKICHMINTCIQLRDGKLYTCVEIAYIPIFNEYFGTNLEVTEKDYIDIYKAQSKEEIFNFLCKPVPFCRYCNIKKIKKGLDWKVSKKEISEWI
jgi:MoaA/NifB/PqqE/SkfB family radical SAM enzyme